jgi:hypothetical protein
MYQMPVRAIKNILGKELQSHYQSACQRISNDIQRGFIHRGYNVVADKLESSQSYDDLQGVLTLADYRMSLQEWIESL